MTNNTFAKPYAIFIDHQVHSIVLSIRGTLSLEDCITDAMAQPMELTEMGLKWSFDGVGRYGHGGMVKAAHHIRTEIQEKRLFRKLFGTLSRSNSPVDTPTNPSMESPLRKSGNSNSPTYPHYNLIITGHSLGAATAVLLSLMLKAEYPHLKCITYG